ncbi:MAG: DeoR/GlpR family DNA-binding transcription regulator [Planktomarina sp.]
MSKSSERRNSIIAQLQDTPNLSSQQLAQAMRVTVQTIRSDLRYLAQAGVLERTHGGAIAPSGVRHIEYTQRRNLNRSVKDKIARATARLIPNDSSIFLNIGTTTEAIAKALHHHQNLIVVTNNLNVATILASHPSAQVVVTGGQLRQTDGGLTGDLAVHTVQQFRVDYAIIGASALDASGDLLDFDPQEVRVTQTILDQARVSILVADGSKFQRVAPVRITSMQNLDHVVIDHMSEVLFNTLADAKTNVHLV